MVDIMAKKRLKKHRPRHIVPSGLLMKLSAVASETPLLDGVIQQLESGYLDYCGNTPVIKCVNDNNLYTLIPALEGWVTFWERGIPRFKEQGINVDLDLSSVKRLINCLEYDVMIQRSHISEVKKTFEESKKLIVKVPYKIINAHCSEEIENDKINAELKMYLKAFA